MSIRVSIIGATGYTGSELIKLLLKHPRVTIAHITSESSPGQPISTIHPNLKSLCDLRTQKLVPEKIYPNTDIAFFCLPHGQSAKPVSQAYKKGIKIIDLSADFRFRSSRNYENTYQVKHPARHLLPHSVYGLPELRRADIFQAQIIGNPGCYAAATLLAAAPFVDRTAVRSKRILWNEANSIIVDAKSGISGAGKKLDILYHFVEANESLTPYAAIRHRHVPEIVQELSLLSGRKTQITFVPHLVPMNRGMMITLYIKLKKTMRTKDLIQIYTDYYKGEPFIRILKEGSFPSTKNVLGTNFCDIGFAMNEQTKTAVIMSSLDNLIKGAAGTAIQNMNLMMGLNESESLL